jgi:inner membrane protein
MDLVTQGLAGALLAQGVAPRAEVRRAAVVGAIAGMLPDADVLIWTANDPLLTLEFHRHFTHSLAFAPFGALLVALVLWPCLSGGLTFKRTWLYALTGILAGGLLDACTSFGTMLLWPFSDERIAWSLVAIVDPLFSLVLVIALIFSLRFRIPSPARIGIGVAGLYLAFAFVQHERAESVATALAQSRGHQAIRSEVKPTLGNIVLWRSIYQVDQTFHVDAVRVGWFGGVRIYPGGSVEALNPARLSTTLTNSVLGRDIERFARLSDNYIVWHPSHEDVIGDARYAMLPNGVDPLWGIRIDPEKPERHVSFHTFRSFGADLRRKFMNMLRGIEPDGP